MPLTRALPPAVAAVLAAVAAGCGSSSSSSTTPAASPGSSSTTTAQTSGEPSSTTTGTGSATGTTDSCLVGKWQAQKVTVMLPGGGTATGGAGEILTVSADGTFTDDFAHAQPVTGTSSGHQYQITYAGSGSGRVTSSAGSVTVVFTDPSVVTATVTQDGQPLTTQHPPASQTQAYQCQQGGFTSSDAASGNSTVYVAAS